MEVVLSEKMVSFLSGLNRPENEQQKSVIQQLEEMDFPTSRNEYWKYTRVGKIVNTQFKNSFSKTKTLNFDSIRISDNYIIIENGIIREDLSQYNSDFKIDFISALELNDSVELSENDVFAKINTGFYKQAIKINIAAGATIEAPLQLIYIGTGENIISNNRIAINAEKSSTSSIIVSAISNGSINSFNNLITTVNVGENSQLTIHKTQTENETSLSVSTEQVKQARNSTFKINTFTLSGLLVRNNINIAVAGENCESYMNGAIITKGKQHVDNHTFVDHQVANCYSNENYKYVLDGHSTGVFNGRVVVQKDAQIINAYQNNGNILLSETASIKSKPELEIYADDVKCSHGSTTGQLDEDALFYLETRGISRANARKLMVSAFIGEVINSVENNEVISLIHSLLKNEHGWDFE